jgi:hypothetical protein
MLSKAEARSNRMLEELKSSREVMDPESVGWQYWHLQRLLRHLEGSLRHGFRSRSFTDSYDLVVHIC